MRGKHSISLTTATRFSISNCRGGDTRRRDDGERRNARAFTHENTPAETRQRSRRARHCHTHHRRIGIHVSRRRRRRHRHRSPRRVTSTVSPITPRTPPPLPKHTRAQRQNYIIISLYFSFFFFLRFFPSNNVLFPVPSAVREALYRYVMTRARARARAYTHSVRSGQIRAQNRVQRGRRSIGVPRCTCTPRSFSRCALRLTRSKTNR